MGPDATGRHGGERTSWSDRLGDFVFWCVIPALCLAAVFYGVQDIGPSYKARFGDGQHGTFVGRHESCSRTCFWTGDFYSTDGRLLRHDVGLGSGDDPTRVGDSVPAVDTGDRALVFPRGGGWDWVFVTVILAAGLGFGGWYAVQGWWWVRWRRERRSLR